MHQCVNKPDSNKVSFSGGLLTADCKGTPNLYTNNLNHLHIQRTPLGKNEEDGFDEDNEIKDEDLQNSELVPILKMRRL